MLAMLVSAMSFAQHPGVQGVPRSQVKNSVKSEPAVVYPGISIDSIRYWVGTGRYMSALVVKWDDGKGGNKNLVWGYRWRNASDATGEAMLRAVAKEDPRFYMLVMQNQIGHMTIGGIGFDLNENGITLLDRNGEKQNLNDGICTTSYYDFDDWNTNDTQDHWRSGWQNGFWICYLTDDIKNPWNFSGIADPTLIKLGDGSVFGLVYSSDLQHFDECNMDGEIEYVSVPENEKASVITVQGAPRKVEQNLVPFKSPTDATCDVDFSKIQRWIGEGDNQAALVVKWNDDKESRLYVWGYRWNDNADASGSAMLCKVAEDDPYFSVLIYGGTQYGDAIGGIGYDFDGDGFCLKKGDSLIERSEDHTYRTTSYDFDDYSAGDTDDLWFSGWYDGYWSYWVCDKSGKNYGYSSVGATGRKLTDGCVDGWSAVRDMSNFNMGNMIGELYYLPSLTAGSSDAESSESESSQTDYSKGVFVVNEDWYGHNNSTLNYLDGEGEWVYRVVQKENPGVELGCTAQYGTIYGDKFYVMSKQAKDPGASITGGRITVLDAKTMKVENQIQTISVDADGDSNADGRGFLGVDEHKGYVGTSNGIYILNLDNNEVEGSIEGSGSDDGGLYGNQIGTMVRVNDKVFAVHQEEGLLVINPETDKIEQILKDPDGAYGFGSVVLSKDGNLWLSVATDGSGGAANYIIKLDPSTLNMTRVNIPEGFYGPANSWYAWTPDCFCASKQNNVLYWNGGNSSWFSGQMIFKYDIDKNEFKKIIDLTDASEYIYGCSFRIDPVTDEAYTSIQIGNQYGNNCELRKYDNEGNLLASYSMISNYWFPSIPVFPDNEAPVVNPVAPVSITSADVTTVSLKDLATDADNMDAAIVKTVKSVSNTDVLTAEMLNGDLVITPVAEGTADIVLQVNSNGKLAETTVNVTVSGATGIGNVNGEGATEVARYTLDGKRLDAPQRGVNIVRMSDGTMKKVVVK